MASLRVLTFDHEGHPIQFDTWLDDLQLYLLSDSRDNVSLFDHTSGASLAPPTTADTPSCSRSVVAVGATLGTPRTPFFEGRPPSPLAPSYASTAALDVLGAEDVGAASASGKRCSSKGKGGRSRRGGSGSVSGGGIGGGGGSGGGGSGGSGGGNGGVGGGGSGSGGCGGSGGSGSGGSQAGVTQRGGSGGGQRQQQQQRRSETPLPQQLREWFAQHGASGGSASCPYVIRTGDRAGQTCGKPHTQHRCFSCLDDAWRIEFGIEAAALGASESALPSTAPAAALHTFTLDSGASRRFFRDSTNLTPLLAPVPVRLADPSGGPVLARSSTILPCPAVPSGSKSGLHLPSFFTNLVSTTALQDAMVTTPTPGGLRVSICTCTRIGLHLAVFTHRPGSSLYTLTTEPPQVAVSAQVSASGPVAPPCSFRLLSHQTLLWHHCLGHPSLPRLRGMHSRLLCASPHSSFPPTTAPLHTLHMDVWGPARVSGQGREWYFLLVVDDYTRYTTVFPLRSKGEVVDVLIPWIRTVRLQLRERFGQDLPVLRLHSDRGGEFSSDLLRDFCHGEGILQPFTLPASPQQNGIAERRIGLVMEVARTSMIHAAAPHFLWPFVFYHPTSRNVLPSHDVTFDESVPFYRLFPYRTAPLPPAPLFLAPGPPPVDPLPPQGPTPSGVFQVDPLPDTVPVEVNVASGAARGAASWGAEPARAELGGAETAGAEPGGAEPEGAEPGGAESEGAESGGAEPRGTASSGGPAVPAGAGGPGGAGAAGPGGARTRGTRAAGAGGAGGAGAGDLGASGAGAGGPRAVDPRAGGAGAGGAASGGTSAGGTVQRRPFFVPPPPPSLPPLDSVLCEPDSPLPAPSPYAEQTSSFTEHREPASRPASPVRAVRTGRRVPRPHPPPVPVTHVMALRPSSVPLRVPLPPPPESSLPAIPDPESDLARAATPVVSRLIATVVTDLSFESTAVSALVAEVVDFAAACRLDYATGLVAESESDSPPSVGGECALGTDILEDRQEDFECLAAAVPHLVAMLLAPEGDPDAPDIPTPRSYAEAITGPYSSQWETAMDAEMASWKSTGSYVNAVPPYGANIGVDFFHNFSFTPKMTTLWVLLHVASQHDYELHSLDFSTNFLQGYLHEEIWLRRPHGFTGSFPASTQWSLRRPVYGPCQVPLEWHDTLRTTLAPLGFAPSTADQSLFLRTDTLLPPFYVLVYVDNLVFTTADTGALALVKSELQKRHTCTNLAAQLSWLADHPGQSTAHHHPDLVTHGAAGPSALRLPVLLATVHSSAYRSLALSSTFGRVRRAEWPLNLWPRVSLPETSPTLRWTGKVGDASVLQVWGSRVFVRDTSTEKFSSRAVLCGLAPSGVSQVDPLPGTVPVEVAVDSGVVRGAVSGGAERASAKHGGAESAGAEHGGAESKGVKSGGAELGGAEPGVTELESAEPGGAESEGTESGGAEPWGTVSAGGIVATSLGGAGVSAGAGGTGGVGAAGPRDTGAAGSCGVGGAGAGGAGARDPGAGGAGAGGICARGAGAGGKELETLELEVLALGVLRLAVLPDSPLPAQETDSSTERRELESRPALPVCAIHTGRRVPRSRPPPVPGTHIMALRPSSVTLRVPMPPPPESSLPAVSDPASDLARAANPTVPRLLATVVTDPSFESTSPSALVAEVVDIAAACRLDYATSLVAESESDCLPSVGGECALDSAVLEDRQEDFESLAAAIPHLVAMLLAPEGDPDAPDIPTPRSYAQAITGPYSSQRQKAMDAEMASWKSTDTYVNTVPPSGANIVDGMWIFRVKRLPRSPPIFKACYVARGFSQRQGVDFFHNFSPTPKMTTLRVLLHYAAQHDYELHSPDFSTAFLQSSLHEEIWLRCPPGFTGSFPAGTQWSLRRPVYGLRQAPREWHDTLRTTLAALGFVPSTADPSQFLRTNTSLPPLYVLMYVDDLVFSTADTEALALVKSELQKRHTCIDLGELRSYLGLQITRDRARRTITLTLSHMVHQVLQRFGFRYSSPQSTMSECICFLACSGVL
ncbi:unnamed protein product [Closterium sp. NIES-54]